MNPVEPWQTIAWPVERIKTIYRDWGLFYKNHERLDVALQYYDKSLELSGFHDAKALHQRSACKRNLAMTKSALEDGLKAAEQISKSAPLDMEICETIYELNNFEHAKIELHSKGRKYHGTKLVAFRDYINLLSDNFCDILGESLGPFILRHGDVFPHVVEELNRLKNLDPRPLWKILKEQGKCDVVSIPDMPDQLLSPREIARRERSKRVFTQIYLSRAWQDVTFVRSLLEDKNLLLKQCEHSSSPKIRELLDSKYPVLRKFLKNLHARSPLYNEKLKRFSKIKATNNRFREAHLFRIQCQTRRNMIIVIRSVKQLRKENNVERLASYVEKVMGDYVVLKTYRVMPWKFEFLNEVYNTLALAYLDLCTVPKNVQGVDIFDLLRIPREKYKDHQFVFGDRSTYHENDASDDVFMTYKQFSGRLEMRMKFAKHAVERCYLYHAIAANHLKHHRYDDCTMAAHKGEEEAKARCSAVWQFLCKMQTVKAHASLHKAERTKEALEEALAIAERIKNTKLHGFIEQCLLTHKNEYFPKKTSKGSFETISRRSRMSVISRLTRNSSVS